MAILRPLEYGFPLTLSRNTDIPKFWMKRVFQWIDRGWLYAPHPQTGLLRQWSLKPEDVHSLVWWSKDYTPFILHPRREELDAYRQVFCMTITGYPEWELKVPELDKQLDVLRQMVELYGPEKMQWRYSPVPLDMTDFERIVKVVSDLGINECYYSFLHSETLIPETRSLEERRAITAHMAEVLDQHGMTLLGCWDDAKFMELPNTRVAKCVDAERINKLYGLDKMGLKHLPEANCGCSMTLEVATQKLLPCPHACSYCYAAPQNMV